jgi:hypothetical protein
MIAALFIYIVVVVFLLLTTDPLTVGRVLAILIWFIAIPYYLLQVFLSK